MLFPLELSDEQWQEITPHLCGKLGDVGATATDNRLFIDAVLWIACTGQVWRQLPTRFGKWNTVYRRYKRWGKKGLWERVYDLFDRPELIYLLLIKPNW